MKVRRWLGEKKEEQMKGKWVAKWCRGIEEKGITSKVDEEKKRRHLNHGDHLQLCISILSLSLQHMDTRTSTNANRDDKFFLLLSMLDSLFHAYMHTNRHTPLVQSVCSPQFQYKLL